MPDPEFLDELAHELKNQFPSNADQRDESEFFYESIRAESATTPSSTPGSSRPTTTRSAAVRRCPDDPLAPGAERLPQGRGHPARPGADRPGWFHVGRKKDVPRDACYVGRHGQRYVWVGPEGARP